jgi:hypothetical protein
LAVETGRVIKRKHIQLPQGGSVDIPVITQITFLDVVDQGQESEFHLENGSAGKRDVRVASIPGHGGATDESGSGSGLRVERIDTWRVLDVVERGQETDFHPDSKTVKQPPDAPPYFVTHEKTRVVKYINTPDDGNWIKSELIDKWKFGDVVDQGQETEYFLFNPPDNAGIKGLTLGSDSDGTPTIAVDPGLDAIGDAVDPVRTDPFQNIVDFSAAGGTAHVDVWVRGFIHGLLVDASGTVKVFPVNGGVVFTYAFNNPDDSGLGQDVAGTLAGMPADQSVAAGSTGPISEHMSGTIVTGLFQLPGGGGTTSLSFDISAMTFTPDPGNPFLGTYKPVAAVGSPDAGFLGYPFLGPLRF